MKKVMSRVTKTTDEDNLVKESRNRVQRAYEALSRSTNTTLIIPVKDGRLTEAERIVNASSDSEVLQVFFLNNLHDEIVLILYFTNS